MDRVAELVRGKFDTDVTLFSTLEVRTTATQTSSFVDLRGYPGKAVKVNNSLDTTGTLRLFVNHDNTTVEGVAVGSNITLTASTNLYLTDADVPVLGKPLPWLYAELSHTAAPTTGSITVRVIRSGS